MNSLREPSLQSSLESYRGSNDSLLAESLQLDIEELDDIEYSIPPLDSVPTLESVLSELDGGGDSDIISESGFMASATPTPSMMMDELPRMGTILRHTVLQGITAQVGSAADRVNSGLATSAAIADMIAVGTSHGHILAFDNAQTLRWCCKDFTAQGTVSALAFNDDCTRLLCGFARGLIVMIDTSTGNIIRTLSDVITPNSGVLNIRWTARPALAICSDTGGSVWSLNFTRKLGIRGCDSKCLFSGARGEVCAIEPLTFSKTDTHPLKSYCIAALATLSKILVILIRPRLKVIKYQPLSGPSECLPLLSWQMVLIQAADSTQAVDPVLAAARGSHLYFLQISCDSGKIHLMLLRHITLSYNLLSIHWLGPKSMAYLDTSEILHLIDIRTNKELECIDMGAAGLVYSSAQYKGFATGGNVSPAFACAGKSACYNSIISRNTNIYFLGARSMHSVNVRSWSDRITYLLSHQRWPEACHLAIAGYRSAKTSVNQDNRKLTKDRILDMINEYLMIKSVQNLDLYLPSIIECCIEIEEYHLIWNDLWELQTLTSTSAILSMSSSSSSSASMDTYFTVLTEHIENGKLRMLAPQIAQELCSYWLRREPKRLETILLNVDWKCLDLHQVLTATRKEKLYNANIYLNTHALGDYSISLTEFIPKISNDDRRLGNSLLVYISSCLAGRGYPTGHIKTELIPSVKHEVLRCLTSIHSIHANDSELPYPYLRALLRFDTRETLNVLSLAFQEKEFTGKLGQSHRHLIVNILCDIINNENGTWPEIGCLINFIAQQIATKSLPDDSELLTKVMTYLRSNSIANESVREHFEREEAWIQLLDANCLVNIDDTELLNAAENAKCYRVKESILEKHERYEEIFNCYLMDANRHIELWTYIKKYAEIPSRKIYESIYKNFEQLLTINYEELTQILINCFSTNDISNLIRLLERTTMTPMMMNGKDLNTNDGNDKNPNRLLYLFLDTLQKNGGGGASYTMNVQECEMYIHLCCQYNPESIEIFLKQNNNYRLDAILLVLQKYQLISAQIYLYEKQGDYQSAFQLSLEQLKEAPESTAESYAIQVSGLCSRASECLGEREREELWFPLLQIILLRSDLTLITRNILYAASGHCDLTKLVQLVLQSGTVGNFGDIKHILVSMLSNSKYETLLLKTTAQILDKDLHNVLARDKRKASKGLYIPMVKCILCYLPLYHCQNTDNIFIFGICGHPIHMECFTKYSKTIIKNADDYKMECPRCNKIIDGSDGNGNIKSIHLMQPKFSIYNNPSSSSSSSSNTHPEPSNVLQLEAPPRIGSGNTAAAVGGSLANN